jgi:hypothetical protein
VAGAHQPLLVSELSMSVVTLLYYALVAFVSVLLAVNLLKSKKWERDVLYVLVLIPFLLRLLRLK